MSEDRALAELETWLAHAIHALTAAERKRLFRRVTRDVAGRIRARMVAQVGPDGVRWAPRVRDKAGKVRTTAKMMEGLRAARRLKATATPEGADVGWSRGDARIAAVHQFGQSDYVDRSRSAVKFRYPARVMLGLGPADIEAIRQAVLTHVAGAP